MQENFNKKELFDNEYLKYLNTALQLFDYENLPNNLDKFLIEKMLLTYGKLIFKKINDNFYILPYQETGLKNQYDEFTEYLINIPYLNLFENGKLENEITIYNNYTKTPLKDLIFKNLMLLTDTAMTLQQKLIKNRLSGIITTLNIDTKKAVDEIIKNNVDNVVIKSMVDTKLEDTGIEFKSIQDSDDYLTLIELQNFYKSQIYEILGLKSNYNMKREALNQFEINANSEILKPYIYNMFECRKSAIDKINKKYNLNIIVKLSNLWDNEEENIQYFNQN